MPIVTAAGQVAHHAERAHALKRQRYQTGPRYGQELAAARKAARNRQEARSLAVEGRQ